MSCNSCYSEVQFADIRPTDTDVVVNGGSYPSNDTVQDLVDNNPQFWWTPGINGVKTLATYCIVGDVDILMQVSRGGTPTTAKGTFIGPHPVHRPPR